MLIFWATNGKPKRIKIKADRLSAKLSKREKEYTEAYNKNMKKLEEAEATGNDRLIEKYSKAVDEAQEGKFQMALAQSEITAMENDSKMTFAFKDWDKSANTQRYTWDGTAENPIGRIPYDIDGHFGLTAHETKHGAQQLFGYSTPDYASGNKTRFKADGGNEREGYVRQYFAEPGSMPITVNSYREINLTIISSITERGKLIYPNLGTDNSMDRFGKWIDIKNQYEVIRKLSQTNWELLTP